MQQPSQFVYQPSQSQPVAMPKHTYRFAPPAPGQVTSYPQTLTEQNWNWNSSAQPAAQSQPFTQTPPPNSLAAFDLTVAAAAVAMQPNLKTAIEECSLDLSQVFEMRRQIFDRQSEASSSLVSSPSQEQAKIQIQMLEKALAGEMQSTHERLLTSIKTLQFRISSASTSHESPASSHSAQVATPVSAALWALPPQSQKVDHFSTASEGKVPHVKSQETSHTVGQGQNSTDIGIFKSLTPSSVTEVAAPMLPFNAQSGVGLQSINYLCKAPVAPGFQNPAMEIAQTPIPTTQTTIKIKPREEISEVKQQAVAVMETQANQCNAGMAAEISPKTTSAAPMTMLKKTIKKRVRNRYGNNTQHLGFVKQYVVNKLTGRANQMFQCLHCMIKTPKLCNMIDHQKTHRSLKNFECPRCSHKFNQASNRDRHYNNGRCSPSVKTFCPIILEDTISGQSSQASCPRAPL